MKLILILAILGGAILPAHRAEKFTVQEKEANYAQNKELNSQIGFIKSDDKSICLQINNPNLKVGDRVTVIITAKPQKILETEIGEKPLVKKIGDGFLDDNGVTDYQLKAADKDFLKLNFGVGIVNAKGTAKVVKNAAVVDLDGDNANEYFRECTSREGLRLTVWRGKPLKGKRLWHTYYGLGYDTVPNCKNKDFENTTN